MGYLFSGTAKATAVAKDAGHHDSVHRGGTRWEDRRAVTPLLLSRTQQPLLARPSPPPSPRVGLADPDPSHPEI